MASGTGGSGYVYDIGRGLGLSTETADRLELWIARPVEVVLIITITVVCARLGSRLIRRGLGRVRHRASDLSRASRIDTISRMMSNLWRITIYLIGVGVVLSAMGINLTPLLAGATVIGMTIGFGAQSLVRDFLSGILMFVEDQYRIGDAVAINEIQGVVDELTLRVTRLRDADGTEWYIPNGQILKVGNRARHWSRATIDAQVRIDTDIAKASALLSDITRKVAQEPDLQGKVLAEPRVLGVTAVSAGAITIEVEIRVRPLAEEEVRRALLEAVTSALRGADMLPSAP